MQRDSQQPNAEEMHPGEQGGSARSRWKFIAAAVATVLIGLTSRQLPWVPAWVGDMLWATTMYFLFSALTPRAARSRRGAAALTFSYLIELSQLYHRPWLDRIRDNAAGHLVLGSTFTWTDIAAYTAGVALGIAITAPRLVSVRSSTVTRRNRSR
jgi:hypothetical protein